MTTIAEIEAAIENLPISQVDELLHWLETLRARRVGATTTDAWLERARGTAVAGVTTENVLACTRGEG